MVSFKRSSNEQGVLDIYQDSGRGHCRGVITAKGTVVWIKHATDGEFTPEDLREIASKCGEVTKALARFDEKKTD